MKVPCHIICFIMEARIRTQQILATVIASLLREIGMEFVNHSTLQMLIKLLETFIQNVGRNAHFFCEVTGRTEPLLSDVLTALSDMGINMTGIENYAYRPNRMVFYDPEMTMEPKCVNLLQVGHKEKQPNYVPRNLPRFPDPHTYKYTSSINTPEIDCAKVRIKKTEERRFIEKATIKLKMKCRSVDSLFLPYHSNLYPLIPCTPLFPVYRSALLPTHQSCTNEEGSSSEVDEDIDNPYLYPATVK